MAGVVLETRWMRMVSAEMPRRAEEPHARELLLSVAVEGRKIWLKTSVPLREAMRRKLAMDPWTASERLKMRM